MCSDVVDSVQFPNQMELDSAAKKVLFTYYTCTYNMLIVSVWIALWIACSYNVSTM